MKNFIYILIFTIGISTVSSCKRHTCPTYATSGPTKRKKTRHPQKNAPWHKNKSMKKGKNVGTAPQ